MATVIDQPRTGRDHAIKVAKDTPPHKLASAIQEALLRHDTCDLMAMGPDATSRAVVGIALAGGCPLRVRSYRHVTSPTPPCPERAYLSDFLRPPLLCGPLCGPPTDNSEER